MALFSLDKPDSSSSDESNMEGHVSKASAACLGDALKPLSVRIFALLLLNTQNKMCKQPYQQNFISSSNRCVVGVFIMVALITQT